MVTMLGLEWQWLLCGYWNVNGYYVGIGKAMVTMWVLEWQWLLCGRVLNLQSFDSSIVQKRQIGCPT